MLFILLAVIAVVVLFIVLGLDEYGEFSFRGRQVLSLLGLLVCLLGCFTKIPANSVGIVYSAVNGTSDKTLTEGIHTKNLLDKVYVISTENQVKTIDNLTSQTKDAQFVTTSLTIQYKVNSENAFLVFKQYRDVKRMDEILITPTTQRILELVTTKYDVIDILGESRVDVYEEVKRGLSDEFSAYGVDFVSITINDMDAGERIENAIAEEAVAKKAVETAEQNLLKAETEAKQKSVQAKADQEAAKIKAETLLIEAEAERAANELLSQSLTETILKDKWISKWSGNLPQYYGGNADLMIGVE